jgi:thiol:disulfide interchange protein DsbD
MFLVTLLVSGLAFAEEVAGSDTGSFGSALEKGPAVALAFSFGAGFLASLTPCVYPMIIITVSIFGANEAKSRWHAAFLSGMFVLGIVTLFTPVGVAAAASGKLMGSALANPWVVGGIAVVFLTLAASMFGAFEMALPASMTNKLSGVGGVGAKGAFGLGLVCALLAAPCTGPFLTGLALQIAKTKDIALGSGAMAMFAMGLGVPFFIVGTFAISLPKGGAWMLGIKWLCGVVLAYMALAYVRDVVPSLQRLAVPVLSYGVIAGFVLLVGLVLGTVHVLAERRKSPIAYLSKPMKLASIMPAIAGLFMIFTWYPAYALEQEMHGGPPPLTWQTDEAAARQLATKENKAVIVDFGAAWCGACKEMEEKTFPTRLVRTEGARFVAIKVDGTDDEAPGFKAMQKKYGVVGLPTVLLLDKTGKEQARFNEFVPAEKFAAALKKVD